MSDLLSDGTAFSCPFCTSKLKLSVPSSCAKGDSKNLANEINASFPPPGGTCLIDSSPCAPSTTLLSPGQSCVKVEGSTALGAGCMFQCAKGGLIKVDSPGQTIAKHDEASGGSKLSDAWNSIKEFYNKHETLIDIASLFIPGPEELVLAKYGSKILRGGKAAEKVAQKLADKKAVKNYWVYESKNAAGKTQYVGITNNVPRRAAEHVKTKGIVVRPIKGVGPLTKAEARSVEQALIKQHGLAKDGGLMNKINSISPKNSIYDESVKTGEAILKNSGYPGVP